MRIRKLCFFKLSMSLGQLEDLRKVTYFWTSVPMLSSNLIIILFKRGFFVEVKKKWKLCHVTPLLWCCTLEMKINGSILLKPWCGWNNSKHICMQDVQVLFPSTQGPPKFLGVTIEHRTRNILLFRLWGVASKYKWKLFSMWYVVFIHLYCQHGWLQSINYLPMCQNNY